MEKSEILTGINQVFKKVLKNEDIVLSYETNANDIDEWDSINHTILMGEIQKEFKVRFKLKEILKFEKIEDICELILLKMNQQ